MDADADAPTSRSLIANMPSMDEGTFWRFGRRRSPLRLLVKGFTSLEIIMPVVGKEVSLILLVLPVLVVSRCWLLLVMLMMLVAVVACWGWRHMDFSEDTITCLLAERSLDS